jgi:hypothetical protein
MTYYCNWLLAKVEDDPHKLDVTSFFDEAWFHLTGYINSEDLHVVDGKSTYSL